MSIEKKLSSVLHKLTHENPEVRYHALAQLNEWKEDDALGIDIAVLIKAIMTAGSRFPDPVEEWDDPGYFLIDFAADYDLPEVAEAMAAVYPSLGIDAKKRVIDYLVQFPNEQSLHFLLDLYEADLQTDQAYFPMELLYDQPGYAKAILERFFSYLGHDIYQYSFAEFLHHALANQLMHPLQPEVVMTHIERMFQQTMQEAAPYFKEYHPRYVYRFWKKQYFPYRRKLTILVGLLEYYYSESAARLLKEAMTIPDPFIQTRSATAALQRNMEVEEQVLRRCAENWETSESLYWELLTRNKNHLFQVEGKKQPYFAVSNMFHWLMQEETYEDFPRDIRVIDQVDTVNTYDQPVRYYLMAITPESDSSGEKTVIGWAGAFSLEAGEDEAYLWEGTSSSFDLLSDRTIEEHKQHFLDTRAQRKKEQAEEIYYQNDKGTVVVKQLDVSFQLTPLEEKTIAIKDIKKVALEERVKSGFLWSKRENVIALYDRKNQLMLEIPEKQVDYTVFAPLMEALTSHLKEPPLIEGWD